jgi:hypothetical protein
MSLRWIKERVGTFYIFLVLTKNEFNIPHGPTNMRNQTSFGHHLYYLNYNQDRTQGVPHIYVRRGYYFDAALGSYYQQNIDLIKFFIKTNILVYNQIKIIQFIKY